MKRRALVIGTGVAGLSCAQLLAHQGWEVEICKSDSPRPAPTLVLNDITGSLLCDIWQAGNELLDGSHILNERKVAWGLEETVSTVVQRSIVIRGDLLVERLLRRLRHNEQVRVNDSLAHVHELIEVGSIVQEEFSWVVDASGRGAHLAKVLGAAKRHLFGLRRLIGMEVLLAEARERDTCWIETVPDGWVFLAPLGKDQALLQAMVPGVQKEPKLVLTELLDQTRMIKTKIADTPDPALVFEAYPQISDPLCGPGWIAVGDAAISLDPICGDGTGYALREAILAAGVIEGVVSGLPQIDCLHHYVLRLRKAFLSHLKECLRYYSVAFSSPAWEAEVDLIEKAFPYDEYHTADAESLAYGLRDFRLVRLNPQKGHQMGPTL